LRPGGRDERAAQQAEEQGDTSHQNEFPIATHTA
jgi:hypothetical protein